MSNAMLQDRHEDSVYQRVEVITGRRRRRNWTTEEKARIVAESCDGEVNISEVARRYGINRGLLSVWRRQARELGASLGAEPMFATVRIGGDEDRRDEAGILTRRGAAASARPAIEVEMCGATVRIPEGADRATLDAVIWALRGTR
jgi:transposase